MKRAAPLAEFLETCLAPTVAKQGFSGTDVVVSWPEIVGERLAAYSQPVKVEWPRRANPDAPADPSTLVVRVESAFALELQHLAPVIIERVNAFYGWRCVGRLVLKQGPVVRPARPEPLPEPGPAERARAVEAASEVADEGLRGALERLGSAVLAAERRYRGGTGSPPVPHSS
ncbi:DUF721 domain-containing protein [Enterovirga aerilata]|uniref:DUF721 domain-containing protein n=1 Tax=Enterovirga aerilata TaxID=2730920 RepID=A0A849I9C6_9HYPH|nr:DciA family protein [Enterovirga sp. DB1703]NNM73009.1 DUF721 domain-containing protein [Enterovirga sp. DB1703]